MDETWLIAAKRADFDAIAEKFHIDKVLARILRNRDLTTDEEIGRFLNGDLSDLHDGSLMVDMDKALFVLKESIQKKERIRIIGDYDVDGISATYILLRGLRALGADADTVIPHRITDGYGLNDRLIEDAARDGVALIVTCDNGIAAAPQIALANSLGLRVVVTDHHEVPYEDKDGKRVYLLPEAEAVVDPKRADCHYPFPGICGAVVAYKLVGLLCTECGADPAPLLRELLPFAALATVCDVMELKDENRIIVKYGLRAMVQTENAGLRALLAVNDLTGKELSGYHLGFILGPCLNATGRLDTARRAVELFGTEDYGEALTIAQELKDLNDARKKMTEDGAKEAIDRISQSKMKDDRVLVVYLPDTHESIAGIIAGRVKEYFYRPAFVLTDAEEGIKGSGRSIESYDMYAELTKVKELFTKFGGHKMAAGLSLPSKEAVEELRKRLNANCVLTDKELSRKVHIDVPMPLSYASMPLTESFSLLEPFGTGNPKPVFADRGIAVLSYVRVGKNKNVGKLKISDTSGKTFDAVYFGDQDCFERELSTVIGDRKPVIDIVYYPEINEYRGMRSLQIVIDGYRKTGGMTA